MKVCIHLRQLVLCLLLLHLPFILQAQTLKTQTQKVNVGRFQGTLTYQYYEAANGSWVKHGKTTLVCEDSDESSFDKGKLKYKGTATFRDGKLDGALSVQSYVELNHWDSHLVSWTKTINNISFSGSFSENLPHGTWTYKNNVQRSYGSEKTRNDYANVTYNKGVVVGDFSFKYESASNAHYEGKGKTNAKGEFIGESMFKDSYAGANYATVWVDYIIKCTSDGWLEQHFHRQNGQVYNNYTNSEKGLELREEFISGTKEEDDLMSEGYYVYYDTPKYNNDHKGVDIAPILYMDMMFFQTLTGIAPNNISFDKGHYKYVGEFKLPVLTKNIWQSIENMPLKEFSNVESDTLVIFYDKANKFYAVRSAHFNKYYYIPNSQLNDYRSKIHKFNVKLVEYKKQREEAKENQRRKEWIEYAKSEVTKVFKNPDPYGTYLEKYLPKELDVEATAANMSRGYANPSVYKFVTPATYTLDTFYYDGSKYRVVGTVLYEVVYTDKNKPCENFKMTLEFPERTQAIAVLSNQQYTLPVTQSIKNQLEIVKKNTATICASTHSDVVKQYTKHSNSYNLKPDYSSSKMQKRYLPIVSAIIDNQNTYLQFIALRDTIQMQDTQIRQNIGSYKNIGNAYKKVSKTWDLGYQETGTNEARLKEMIKIEKEFLTLLSSQNASDINQSIKKAKDPSEIVSIVSSAVNK